MLRIDVPAVFAESLLIPALPDFHRQFPDVAISLGVNDRTINLVSEAVDCVIRIGELLDMSMVGRKLFDMELSPVRRRLILPPTVCRVHPGFKRGA
jgi:DNA-binding transcriptional LysR family regulator